MGVFLFPVSHRLRKQIAGCLLRIGADHPLCKFLQLSRICVWRISIREPGFIVTKPCITGIIRALIQNTVRSIVPYFPRFIVILKTEDFLCRFIIVPVVLAHECRFILHGIMPEHDDRKTVNALPHPLIFFLRWCFVRAGIVIENDQFHVVSSLGGSNVRFIAEGRHRNGVIAQFPVIHG